MKLPQALVMEITDCINQDFVYFKEILSYIPSEILKPDKEETKPAVPKISLSSAPAAARSIPRNVEKQPDTEENTKIKNKSKQKKSKKKKTKVSEKQFPGLTVRQEELREKLRKRIEELQGKHKHLTTDEIKEKKRLKRRESKLKLKAKRRSGKNNTNPKGSENVVVNGDVGGGKGSGVSRKPQTSVVNQEGKLVFSKFDFCDGQKKVHSSDLVGKDYKRILEKLEKRKETLTKLREKDSDLAKKFEDKNSWKTAISRAEGEKVKDDVKLVKKALKLKEKKKQHRQKKWKSREDQVNQRQQKQQEKRQRNIQARIDAKREKKITKAKKKGRNVPGF